MSVPPPLPPDDSYRPRSKPETVGLVIISLIFGFLVVAGMIWLALTVFGWALAGGGGAGGN
jgi:hypothetical protein